MARKKAGVNHAAVIAPLALSILIFAAIAYEPRMLRSFSRFATSASASASVPRHMLNEREALTESSQLTIVAEGGAGGTAHAKASVEEKCEEVYGFLPCSTSIGGNAFLMLVYGYIILYAAKLISEGSELLLQVLDPGLIGGLLLPILGAFPDTLLILVSGISGSTAEAQEQVMVGMGVLAGSTIMILTIAWGGSLICGRCDLEPILNPDGTPSSSLVARDRTLTRPWDLVHTGVTTDEQTRLGAWIMMATVVPFIIMQIPFLDGGKDLEWQAKITALLGLIFSISALLAYCTYQVCSPWLQQSKIRYARLHYLRTVALRDLHNMVLRNTWGNLVLSDGTPNLAIIDRIFHQFDEDNDGRLSRNELRALILTVGMQNKAEVPGEVEVAEWMREFDTNTDGEIGHDEFVAGLSRWIAHYERTHHRRNPSVDLLRNATVDHNFWERHVTTAKVALEGLQDSELEEDVEDEEEENVPKTPGQIYREATLLILGGAVLVAIFADPVVDSITAFSTASHIPAFFVAFVVTPLASNASELVSSLMFALKKRKRTISLTYSQVYGAISMNNTMCLGVFLALVYFRGLQWVFSAEVTIILINTFLVGFLGGSRNTFPTWMAIPVLSLYPLSLGLVSFLDFYLGWQ